MRRRKDKLPKYQTNSIYNVTISDSDDMLVTSPGGRATQIKAKKKAPKKPEQFYVVSKGKRIPVEEYKRQIEPPMPYEWKSPTIEGITPVGYTVTDRSETPSMMRELSPQKKGFKKWAKENPNQYQTLKWTQEGWEKNPDRRRMGPLWTGQDGEYEDNMFVKDPRTGQINFTGDLFNLRHYAGYMEPPIHATMGPIDYALMGWATAPMMGLSRGAGMAVDLGIGMLGEVDPYLGLAAAVATGHPKSGILDAIRDPKTAGATAGDLLMTTIPGPWRGSKTHRNFYNYRRGITPKNYREVYKQGLKETQAANNWLKQSYGSPEARKRMRQIVQKEAKPGMKSALENYMDYKKLEKKFGNNPTVLQRVKLTTHPFQLSSSDMLDFIRRRSSEGLLKEVGKNKKNLKKIAKKESKAYAKEILDNKYDNLVNRVYSEYKHPLSTRYKKHWNRPLGVFSPKYLTAHVFPQRGMQSIGDVVKYNKPDERFQTFATGIHEGTHKFDYLSGRELFPFLGQINPRLHQVMLRQNPGMKAYTYKHTKPYWQPQEKWKQWLRPWEAKDTYQYFVSPVEQVARLAEQRAFNPKFTYPFGNRSHGWENVLVSPRKTLKRMDKWWPGMKSNTPLDFPLSRYWDHGNQYYGRVFKPKTSNQRGSVPFRGNDEFGYDLFQKMVDKINKAEGNLKSTGAINSKYDTPELAPYRIDALRTNYREFPDFFTQDDAIELMQLSHKYEIDPWKKEFGQRLMSPEGQRRLSALGIDPKYAENLAPVKRNIFDLNSGAYYDPRLDKRNIGLGLMERDPRGSLRHEYQHWLQDVGDTMYPGRTKDFKLLEIDENLGKLELADRALYKKSAKPSSYENFDKQKKYFNHAAPLKHDPSGLPYERSPFLSELQQVLVDKKIISHAYAKDEITPEMIRTQYNNYINGKSPKLIRIFNIIKPTQENFKIIADNLNKLPVVAGAAIGAQQLQEKKKGGKIYQNGGDFSKIEKRFGKIAQQYKKQGTWEGVSPEDQEFYREWQPNMYGTGVNDGKFVYAATLPTIEVTAPRKTLQEKQNEVMKAMWDKTGDQVVQSLQAPASFMAEHINRYKGKPYSLANALPGYLRPGSKFYNMGTYEDPNKFTSNTQTLVSDALDIENPYIAGAVDMFADPLILTGGAKAFMKNPMKSFGREVTGGLAEGAGKQVTKQSGFYNPFKVKKVKGEARGSGIESLPTVKSTKPRKSKSLKELETFDDSVLTNLLPDWYKQGMKTGSVINLNRGWSDLVGHAMGKGNWGSKDFLDVFKGLGKEFLTLSKTGKVDLYARQNMKRAISQIERNNMQGLMMPKDAKKAINYLKESLNQYPGEKSKYLPTQFTKPPGEVRSKINRISDKGEKVEFLNSGDGSLIPPLFITRPDLNIPHRLKGRGVDKLIYDAGPRLKKGGKIMELGEILSTPIDQSRGLQYKDFKKPVLFPRPLGNHTFTMNRHGLKPMDMIGLKGGKITGIKHNVQPWSGDYKLYGDAVVEAPAGYAKLQKLRKGSKINFRYGA